MFPVYECVRPYTPDPEFVAKSNPDNQYLYHKSHLAHLKIIRATSKDSSERADVRDQIDCVLERLEFWSKRTINTAHIVNESVKIDADTRKAIARSKYNV